MSNLPVSEQRLDEIRHELAKDAVCQVVMEYCRSGWPDVKKLSKELRIYHTVASELSIEEGLLMRSHQIVIPTTLRADVLRQLHIGHQGIHKCWECARQSIWWPKMSSEIEDLVNNCTECCRAQYQRPQPLLPSKLPDLPWQEVGTDLFTWNGAN